jgi:glycosyltransferase involved in cell wall biosynthesis
VKVVLDGLGLPRFGGARSSALGWMVALARQAADNRYSVFLSRPEPELAAEANLEQRLAPRANRFTVRMWAQTTIPAHLRASGADLYHATKNLAVWGAPCPTVITINDLTHVLLSSLYPRSDRLFWEHLQPVMLRRAQRIIAISQTTRRHLIDHYGLDENQVVVIYPGCQERFSAPVDAATRARVRAAYRLPGRYILYVGGLAKHKNIETLVNAFRSVAGEMPHHLVLVGGRYHTSSDEQLWRLIREGRYERVSLLDAVPDDDMPALYQMAEMFVLPSLNEGFGLTLLEAMAGGVPVIASRRGAMPEVVGDAGLLIGDPGDARLFAGALLALANDPVARATLQGASRKRAAAFTWEATARQTLAVYEDVCTEWRGGRTCS